MRNELTTLRSSLRDEVDQREAERIKTLVSDHPQGVTDLNQRLSAQEELEERARAQVYVRYHDRMREVSRWREEDPISYVQSFEARLERSQALAPRETKKAHRDCLRLLETISKHDDTALLEESHVEASDELSDQPSDVGGLPSALRDEARKIRNYHTSALEQALAAAQVQEELKEIDQLRASFFSELSADLDKLEETRGIIATLFGHYGRLFDLSRGLINRTGFELLSFYQKLAQDPALLALIDELGRMREAELEYEAVRVDETVFEPIYRPTTSLKEDLIGVTIGGDLNQLLPSEYALFADDTEDGALLELIFYQKLIERQLNIYELSGVDLDFASYHSSREEHRPKMNKRGPFILCVDTSGSMHGTPERVAKTLTFLILRRALAERRKCYLIHFSTQIKTLELTQVTQSLDALIHFLGLSFHGGTDPYPALMHSLEVLMRDDYERADVLMISDFVMSRLPTREIQDQQLKGTRFHAVIIGGHTTSLLESFDKQWHYNGAEWSSFFKEY